MHVIKEVGRKVEQKKNENERRRDRQIQRAEGRRKGEEKERKRATWHPFSVVKDDLEVSGKRLGHS
jgi:hypothetical protein